MKNCFLVALVVSSVVRPCAAQETRKPTYPELFEDVWHTINDNFYDPSFGGAIQRWVLYSARNASTCQAAGCSLYLHMLPGGLTEGVTLTRLLLLMSRSRGLGKTCVRGVTLISSRRWICLVAANENFKNLRGSKPFGS